jgi:hypothetical protein
MTGVWVDPGRIGAHRLLRLDEAMAPLRTGRVPRATMSIQSVEDVFHRGLIPDVVVAPSNVIDTTLDVMLGQLIGIAGDNDELSRWGSFAGDANQRRRTAQRFLDLARSDARSFLSNDLGRYLIHALPFEDLARRNDAFELLYFRDSGLHRRLIEQTFFVDPRDSARAAKAGVSLEQVRRFRLTAYEPKRWEAFVVISLLDLVGDHCAAFAYRNDETAEIDLILEWQDCSPPERWAVEVASRKFDRHPSDHFHHSCAHLGVAEANRFLVFRANGCNGTERGRGGVRACALPQMLDCLARRLLG